MTEKFREIFKKYTLHLKVLTCPTGFQMSHKLAETNTEELQLIPDCASTNEILLESVQTTEVSNILNFANRNLNFDILCYAIPGEFN